MPNVPNADFTPFAAQMKAEGLPALAITTFNHYYNQLVAGETGLMPESAIEPVASLPNADVFGEDLAAIGRGVQSQTVLLKLNGGLGTSMGLSQAKSLLPVRDGLNFLDIIAQQALAAEMPLLLMNSFNTREDSLAVLAKYPALAGVQKGLPLDFLQHKVLKVVQADFSPAVYEPDPTLVWCPPGHGDLYTAMITSGILDQLLAGGVRYAFVSNADNLGAVMDPAILGYFVRQAYPFMMEVADRTEADKKGGHLAQLPSGQLVLRESAQTPDEDSAAFQDVSRHRYFNTNNLWLDLQKLKEVMAERGNILGLPMIRNRKVVNPREPDSTPVYQLETAMGSAIAVFEGAGAVRVPRSRFAPVKKTSDLLAVRSDAYVLTDDFCIVPNPARRLGQVVVDLDEAHYKLIDAFEERFKLGVPSLLHCERLAVWGDVSFGRGVRVHGRVEINQADNGPLHIPDNTVLGQV